MRLLFIGDSWLGSSARSMREALSRQPGTLVEEVAVDLYIPSSGTTITRIFNRALGSFQRQALQAQVRKCTEAFRPDAIIFYKGAGFDAQFLRGLQAFAPVVNIFPDYSPHAYGPVLAEAMGTYDLVISTKPFHTAGWKEIYGYTNRCECVTHGYDPLVDLRTAPPTQYEFDIGIIATGRPEYIELLEGVAARLRDPSIKVLVGGNNWNGFRARLPQHWVFPGPFLGITYIETLRKARIVLAPIQTRVVVDGKVQPGDVDTSRTYQLAAAHCFFIHRRTPYVQSVYDETSEVPMFDDAAELAQKIDYYLERDEERRAMAAAAHARAVPEYSLDSRARDVLRHIEEIRK